MLAPGNETSVVALCSNMLTNLLHVCVESHGDSGTQRQMGLVWQLCVALWGTPEELEEDAGWLFDNAFLVSSVLMFATLSLLLPPVFLPSPCIAPFF